MPLAKVRVQKKINISKNTVSSSFLKINKNHLDIEPNAEFVGKENVKLLSLNNFLNKKKFRRKKYLLKLIPKVMKKILFWVVTKF